MISMVGSAMFNLQLNNRLKDIKGSKDDFGGVSMVAIGDLLPRTSHGQVHI